MEVHANYGNINQQDFEHTINYLKIRELTFYLFDN
jgi:hypothetical protein